MEEGDLSGQRRSNEEPPFRARRMKTNERIRGHPYVHASNVVSLFFNLFFHRDGSFVFV